MSENMTSELALGRLMYITEQKASVNLSKCFVHFFYNKGYAHKMLLRLLPLTC